MSAAKVVTIFPANSRDEARLGNEKRAFESVIFAPEQQQHGWWNGLKSVLLAKEPFEGAPLEYGGHREAEEPARGGLFGVLAKFSRFFGPGMIIAIAYIDPDNFQSSIEDGQDFGYKMLFMILISLCMAIYLQVSATLLIKQ